MTPSAPIPWPERHPLIAILRGISPQEVLSHGQALVAAGIRAIEVPCNSPDWARSVAVLAAGLDGTTLLGAGTVCHGHQLDALVQAGGRLVVTPHVDTNLIADAVRRGLPTAIGCMTPTEAMDALRAGADVLKVFPSATLGPGHIKALRSVLPAHTRLYAVGGISPDNLGDYLRAGCQGAGLGSELYRPGQTADDTFARATRYVAAWAALSPHHPSR